MLLLTIHLFLAYLKSYPVCETQFSIIFMLCHAYILKGDFDWLDIVLYEDIDKRSFIELFKRCLTFFYDCKSVPPFHIQKLYNSIKDLTQVEPST